MAEPETVTAVDFLSPDERTRVPQPSPSESPFRAISKGLHGSGLSAWNERNPEMTNSDRRSPPATTIWLYSPASIILAAVLNARTPDIQAFEITTGRLTNPKNEPIASAIFQR